VQWVNSLKRTLTGLAEARQASVSAETLNLYSRELCEFEPADVRDVVRTLAMRKRAEGETAFPALGDLVEPLIRLRERRQEERKRVAQEQARLDEFWQMVPGWMEITGQSEAEILERWPSFKGTKPR
jgi:hypothetical protein